MRLYHGSNTAISQIDLALSKPYKDFGKGFYLSDDRNQAEAMALRTVERNESGQAIVTVFDFDDKSLCNPSLKVKTFEAYDEEWALFVMTNRYENAKHEYDIVIGPIADDRIGLQILNYYNENIDLPTLVKKISYKGDIHPQYYFGTEKAIELLKLVEYETVCRP